MSDIKPDLPDRAQQMLRSLIDRYVRDGQPVGSRTLARELGLNLSPATIRNVMSDLEALGFISSPHTSAGRIPTVQGYRFFVDTLLKVQPLDSRSIEKIRLELSLEQTPIHLVESASELLSGITHLAGVVTLPSHEHALFKRVEFIPLSENRVLAILVTGEDEVQNSILTTDTVYRLRQSNSPEHCPVQPTPPGRQMNQTCLDRVPHRSEAYQEP